MNENNYIFQYQDCTLENLVNILKEQFGQEVSKDDIIKDMCADNLRKMEKLQKGIEKNFGVHITYADLLSSQSVADLQQTISHQIEAPQYPVAETDIRKKQVKMLAEEKEISILTGTLKDASEQLGKSLENIEKLSTPTEKIGYHTKWEWANKTLNFVDSKVSHGELRDVITQTDSNLQAAFKNIGDAIDATNKWIDAICEALIWIVQIENDLYDISDETSEKALTTSRLLSQDGKNIEGLTEFAKGEKEKRQNIQNKIKTFKSDIEGKIDFLNDVNQRIRKQFEEHRTLIAKEQSDFFLQCNQHISDTLKKLNDYSETLKKEQQDRLFDIKQQVDDSLSTVEKTANCLIQKQEEFIANSEKQTSQALEDLSNKQKENSESLFHAQQSFEHDISKSLAQKHEEIGGLVKSFMHEESTLVSKLSNR